jgi:hypothetical protein
MACYDARRLPAEERVKRIILVLAAVVAAAGCHEEPTIVIRFEPTVDGAAQVAAPKRVDAATAPDLGGPAECKSAADCAVEPDDCCDCAHGGRLRPVARAQLSARRAARQSRCKEQMCAAMLSTDPSCEAKPECVGGHCVLALRKTIRPKAK